MLVVDDQAPIRELCRVNLELAGMRVIEAADGPEALRQARSQRPDAVLLDILMPGFSGWRVAADLAADPATVDIPIVFISALAERAARLRGFELGAVGYITKPFDPTALGPAIHTLLDRLDEGQRDDLLAEQLADLGASPSSAKT